MVVKQIYMNRKSVSYTAEQIAKMYEDLCETHRVMDFSEIVNEVSEQVDISQMLVLDIWTAAIEAEEDYGSHSA